MHAIYECIRFFKVALCLQAHQVCILISYFLRIYVTAVCVALSDIMFSVVSGAAVCCFLCEIYHINI